MVATWAESTKPKRPVMGKLRSYVRALLTSRARGWWEQARGDLGAAYMRETGAW